MDTYTDAPYMEYLNQTGTALPYMMPISPWFYTNLPGYQKNWVWRGDHLWHDRWLEAWYLQPEFVEIISWNDYGESHYIGPIRDHALEALDIGEAPFDYVTNMPHDGWRLLLEYVAATYKYDIATIDTETLVTWYRLQPVTACGTGGTSANTAHQLQLEFDPTEVFEDMVLFSALLEKPADVSVTIGGVQVQATWRNTPDHSVAELRTGIYHGQAALSGHTGEVVVTISRDGDTIAQVAGEAVTTTCTNGLANFNAWVGSAQASSAVNAIPPTTLDQMQCVNGTGAANFAGLCEYACQRGYCPVSACTCLDMGEDKLLPNATGVQGYPLEGLDASYSGLCSFDCDYGYCPDSACTTVSAPLSTPTVSDFAPPACIKGSGEGNLAGLCSYACGYGFCPMNACTCTEKGALVVKNPTSTVEGVPTSTEDEAIYGPLCSFSCQRGYCPSPACVPTTASATSSGTSGATITIDGSIWEEETPAVTCTPPCDMIMPPLPLSTTTTISFPDSVTVFTNRETVTSTTTYINGDVQSYRSFIVYSHPTVIPIPPRKLSPPKLYVSNRSLLIYAGHYG
ncbi:hypothetical protein AWENTII_007420 [Aspergillus wentii]|nr:hypothetical protein MW887_011370 [Aspergillus wentii]